MEYAQARIQARFGMRADECEWRELRSAGDLAGVLRFAAGSPLKRWVAGITPRSDAHDIERALRSAMRRDIAEVARWVSPPWRPAMRWTADLLDLRALAALAAGDTPHAWMLADPPLAMLAVAGSGLEERLAESRFRYLRGGWQRLRAAPGVDARALYAAALGEWLRRWRAQWPAVPDEEREALEQLVGAVLRHLEHCARGHAGGTPELRRRLSERLVVAFRRGAFTPLAALSYLALEALEAARARAELLRHALLSPAGVAP